MKSTKILALLLVMVMCFGMLASCGLFKKPDPTPDENPDSGNVQPTPEAFTPVASFKDPAVYETVFNGGSITTHKNEGTAGGSVTTDAYAGIEGKDYTDEKVYTYNDYLSAMTGLNWNPLSWETNDDSYILGFLTMGFYDFAINADKTGYSIVPEMAAAMPVDVTSEYVGSYGIAEGESAKAWKIALNPNAKWENGEAITADDYMYSMQQQLDPKALYRRADSYYAGDFQLYNAKNYLYQGQKGIFAATTAYTEYSESLDDKLIFTLSPANATYLEECAMRTIMGFPASYDAVACAAYLIGSYGADMPAFTAEAAAAMEGKTLAEIKADATLAAAWADLIGWWQTEPNEELHFFVANAEYPAMSFDEVGLVKVDDYTLVYITIAPTEEAAFYVPYNLSSTWLVHKATFEASKIYSDAEGNVVDSYEAAAKVESKYFTTLEGTISYGPYKMTVFQDGKSIVFERNDNWYGYSDGKHLGQFQTDIIDVAVISDDKTALQVFLQGDLAGKGLLAEYFEDYSSSDRLVYTPESYTTKLTFNTNYESLVALGGNQQLLSVLAFRKAFGLAVDKEAFASGYTSAGEAGFGLLNYQYCYDPFSGALYRDSEHAMKALVDYYGIEYGEGKDFEDLEEAYNAMTGYDIDAAKALMQAAYDQAVAAGIYDGKSPVTLEILVYNSEDIYVKMVNFFNDALVAATEGTDFEGLVSIELKINADYYEAMCAGEAAIIFSTWGGAAMSPFTMIDQVYTDDATGHGNQNEYGFETENIKLTLTVDGQEITASLQEWAAWCGSAKAEAISGLIGLFTDYDYDTRCAFFAAVECAYLKGYATFGLYYRNSASLVSYKMEQGSEAYLQIVGRGGIRHITYNYDDATWETVKGTFSYTSSK